MYHSILRVCTHTKLCSWTNRYPTSDLPTYHSILQTTSTLGVHHTYWHVHTRTTQWQCRLQIFLHTTPFLAALLFLEATSTYLPVPSYGQQETPPSHHKPQQTHSDPRMNKYGLPATLSTAWVFTYNNADLPFFFPSLPPFPLPLHPFFFLPVSLPSLLPPFLASSLPCFLPSMQRQLKVTWWG